MTSDQERRFSTMIESVANPRAETEADHKAETVSVTPSSFFNGSVPDRIRSIWGSWEK